jgi:hypothetical protein
MKRRITSYDIDEHGDWRAELECGHYQHVRHQPPLVRREWVLTEVGRDSRLGFELNCKRCDEEISPQEPSSNDARLSD